MADFQKILEKRDSEIQSAKVSHALYKKSFSGIILLLLQPELMHCNNVLLTAGD